MKERKKKKKGTSLIGKVKENAIPKEKKRKGKKNKNKEM